jgi:pyridoxine 4-dehydrogenase
MAVTLAGRPVHRVGLGTMRLTGTLPFHAGRPRDRRTSIEVLRRAVELGVDHVDTAAFYFSRTLSANELVNAALHPYDGIVLATKVGPVRNAAGEWADRPSPDGIRAQVEENLRQLGTDHLPLVYFRTGQDPDVTPYVAALADLVTAGYVGAVGVSGVTLAQLEQARTVTEVAAVQNRLVLEDDHDRAVLTRCGELGIAFGPFFTVAGRAHQGRPADEPDAVRQVATELGATPAQVRIAHTLALGEHVLAIPGTGDLAHLEQNVAAADLSLTPDQLARLAGSTP